MAYGSGTSLTGLSFTPYAGIFAGNTGNNVYMIYVHIKGAAKTYICGPTTSFVQCTYTSNSITFYDPRGGNTFYNYDPSYIVAFGY